MTEKKKPQKKRAVAGKAVAGARKKSSGARTSGKAARPRKATETVVQQKKAESESIEALQAQLEEKITELTKTNRQLKRKIFDLYTIFEISRNFNAMLDYETLLDTFIYTCLGQVGALKGAIFLKREAHADRFFPVKTKGSGDLPEADDHFMSDSKLVGYLTRLNRPVPTRDLLGDISTDRERAILSSFDPGIVVPLIYQTRLTGIFAMSEKISGRDFQLDDLEFLSILGNQIAVAIENARLYEGEREAIQQLRAAQQQLLQTERLAALGEMSAKVAHEVNNPLGIIKNYVVLIRRAVEDQPEPDHYLHIVGEEIDRIARIVKQLLAFHRPPGVTLEPVDVTAVIDDILKLMDHQLASGEITIVRDYTPDPPQIMAAPESLKQVFLNLVINARDAMKEPGTLTVTVQPVERQLNIRFCDTGPGIPADIIPHIFEPFFTTKEQGEGTGLGLSVCYGIIKKHGGTITFTNLEPGGCFSILLPLPEGPIADGD